MRATTCLLLHTNRQETPLAVLKIEPRLQPHLGQLKMVAVVQVDLGHQEDQVDISSLATAEDMAEAMVEDTLNSQCKLAGTLHMVHSLVMEDILPKVTDISSLHISRCLSNREAASAISEAWSWVLVQVC